MASRFTIPVADVGNGITSSSGAKLHFTLTGTSTLTNTYSDEALTTANANPVISDSDGVFPDIWLTPGVAYKVVLDDSNDVQRGGDWDPVNGELSTSNLTRYADTIAELKTATSAVLGDFIETRGSVTIGDGGWSRYQAVASGTGTDDGGKYLDSTGSTSIQWLNVFPYGVADVRMFQAVFSATAAAAADHYTEMQACIDSGHPSIRLGEGFVKSSGTLSITQNAQEIFGYGAGYASVAPSGSTILYSGTGEGFNLIGGPAPSTVPFMNNHIHDFRIRKTSQASTKGAFVIQLAAGVVMDRLSVDSDNASYEFKHGFIFDSVQLNVSTLIRAQATSGAGIWYVNGPDYTATYITNNTNANVIIMPNLNGCDIGIAHDGGEGWKLIGGNFNGSDGEGSVRLAGLNSFSIDGAYMEGATGDGDIVVAQTTKYGAVSTGAGGNGEITGCRLASSTTNCIQFKNASIQTNAFIITSNKFGSSRTAAAINSPNLADAVRASFIGPNQNLGGSGKDYLGSMIYDHNEVHISISAQQEAKVRKLDEGGIVTTTGSSRKKQVTFYNRTTGSPYVVLATDHILDITNNSGASLTLTLPTIVTGREITVNHIIGNDPIIVGDITLDGSGASVTIVGDATNSKWRVTAREPVHSTTAILAGVGQTINTKASKIEGMPVFNETTGLTVIASANADDSVWVYQGTGATAHTPV